MSSLLPDEMGLLKQLIAGDAEAFRKLYEFYQGKIFLFAFRLTKSKATAEEVVQEVFVKLWEKRAVINTEKNFTAYILTITKNLILNQFKKSAHDRTVQERIYAAMQDMQNNGIDKVIENEISRLHRQAIEQLSPQRKIVFLLSREEELSYEQIAEKLGISKNTVRNQVSEALQSIREYLSNHPDMACIIIAMILTPELA